MNNDAFAFYFKKIDYHLKSGKGISVFNADGNLFSNFKNIGNKFNLRVSSFVTSDYLKHQNSPEYDETANCVILYQDVNIENLQKIIDPFVNKIIYPAFYTKKAICFFTNQNYNDYCQDQIESSLIHTDLNKVISALLTGQLIKLLDQVNYRFSSPEFLKTSWEKTIYTPIEQILKEALEKENISFAPQVKLGRFYVDFLVECNNQRIIVECDGREYHSPYRDKERDKELSKEGCKILHLTGSEIYNDIDSCIRKIQNINYGTSSQEYLIDEDLLKDESQRRTLNFITGPIRVLAPAGSGKTKTLINKIAQLLNKGIEPNSILALAFNKKAAEEMKQRLKAKGIPVAEHFTKDEGVAVQTFHSFGYEIIRNKLNWVFEEQNADKTTRDLLRKAVEKHQRIIYQRNRDPLDSYLEALRKTKMELHPPIDEVVVEENNKSIPFKNIFYSYLDYQKEHNFINFDDMIYIALRLLINDRILRNQLQNRFRYVLIDEFQDLNRAQLLMKEVIALPQNNIFIVGDDDQMIYGWIGAKVKYLLELDKRYAICQDCTLSTNYRSSKKIVNHSKWLISHNKERVPKNIRPLPDAEKGIFQIELKENLWEQAKIAAKWIRDLKNEKNLNWNDFAVLYRFHAYQFLVAMALDSLRIPHSPVSGKRLFQTKVGRDVYSYLTVIFRSTDAQREDFERIMKRPNKYFTNAVIDRVRNWDTFTDSFREEGLKDWEQKNLKDFVVKIEQLRKITTQPDISSSSLLSKLDIEIGLLNFYKDQSKVFVELDEASDDMIFEVILSVSRNFDRLDDFYAYIHKCICDEIGEPTAEEERKRNEVILSTIHKTKGSEYNNVVYFNLSQDKRIVEESDIEEERRVSYVGVARAKKNILITALKSKPSTFLKELAFNPELKAFSITELEAKKNSKQMEAFKLKNKINTKEVKIEFLLNKYPELKGETRKYSYSFLNSIFLWLREKQIESATKSIDRLNSEVKSLNISKRDLLDSIDNINTEIEFRNKLT